MPRNDVPILFGLAVAVWFGALAKGAHDLWAMTALSGWITLLWILFLWQRYRRTGRLAIPLVPACLWMLVAFLVSSRFSFTMGTTRLELWIWFFSWTAYFLFVNLFRQNMFRQSFLKFGGLIILPLALLTLWQYTTARYGSSSPHWTAQATFTSSAVLAGFALSWIIIFWHFRQKERVYPWLLAGCFLILCLARSWAAFVSLAAGLCFYYQERLKAIWISRRKLAGGISAMILMLLLVAGYYKFALSSQSAFGDRTGWWIAGIRMFLYCPWVGIGLGGYGEAFPFFRSNTVVNTLYAHNALIQLLCETGVFGFTGVLFLGSSYIRTAPAANKAPPELVAYRATVLMIFLFSLTSIYLEYFIGRLMLFMAIALVLAPLPARSIPITKKFFLFASVSWLLLTPSWYLPWVASQYYVAGTHFGINGDEGAAIQSFQKALRLDPYQEESRAALAHIYQHRFEKTHSLLDLSSSMLWSDRETSG